MCEERIKKLAVVCVQKNSLVDLRCVCFLQLTFIASGKSEAIGGRGRHAGALRAATPAARRSARGSRGPCCAPRGGRRSPRGGAGSRHPRCGTTMCPTAMPNTTSSSERCAASSIS